MTTKAAILQAIRNKCLDCSCQQPGEVRECPVATCDLWPYRFGRDPEPSRSRGFARPNGYTSDSSARRPERHADSVPTRRAGKSSVYTSDSDKRGHGTPQSVTPFQGIAP
jgi:hypothetical protein